MKNLKTYIISFLQKTFTRKEQKNISSSTFSILFFIMLILPAHIYADAVDDSFTTPSGTILSENVLTNDSGINKRVYQYSLPNCGQITSFYSDGSFTYDPQSCSGTVTFNYYMYWFQGGLQIDSATVTITITSLGTPPTISNKPTPDQTTTINSTFSLDIDATEPDGDSITYSANGLPPGLSIDSNTGLISGTPTASGSYTVTVTATDKDGSDSDTFIIDVTASLTAVDDSYSMQMDTVLTVGAPGVLGNDAGAGIYITGNTNPSNGTLTFNNDGSFTYTPTNGFYGVDTFTYTIADSTGASPQTATVLINVQINTDYQSGIQDFVLVNPESTRNVIGNYVILGNTVECVTTSQTQWDAACTNDLNKNDNYYMTKYIDIDGDSGIGAATWNSSSANFTLPTSYDQQGGNGILWAGLFWQGSINNYKYYTSTTQRRAYETGGGWAYKYIDNSQNIDMTTQNANKVLLKIDNDTAYTPVQALTFYYDPKFQMNNGDNYGGYYAAYTDITHLLKSKNLAPGDHTITVANIVSNEGRIGWVGDYAGWSIVVIYAEDYLVGKPRNISIYSGYTVIPSSQGVTIEGFKLPATGDVDAQFSVFAGEGEYFYGDDANEIDQMQIQENANSTPSSMPGAVDPTNIFDAQMAGISRDNIGDNAVTNTNGVDIDTYNVSNILTEYRNNNANINSLYISLYSNNDYVTPSMMAFSTELYQPNICYDYTLEVGGYVIPSVDNKIDTSIGAYTSDPLVTRVSIQSKEGDFDFHDVNMTYTISDTTQTQYLPGTTEIARNNQFAYVDASNQTIDETSRGFLIYLGEGASSNSGGIIKPFEKRFVKWKNNIDNNVDTQFSLIVQCTVDYGSGPVPIVKILREGDICRDGGGYFIASDIFNVTSGNANNLTGQPYNLYTQVVNKPFDVKVFSHDPDHIYDDHRLKAANTAVEVEVYNADWFPRDVNLSCLTPDSNISAPTFVDFNNQTNSQLSNLSINYAVSNAGFRVWYLHRADGSLISHHCIDRNDQSCFKDVWENELQSDATPDRNCTVECNAATGCYDCMRRYYGQPVCSKDNFAIRPEAFVISLRDNQQRTEADAVPITNIAHSVTQNQANVVAGYLYRFDINATNYLNDDATRGYYRTFDSQSTAYASTMQLKNKNTLISENKCNDFNDKPVAFTIYEGTNVNVFGNESELGQIEQVGLYEFNIIDSNWTIVDWHDAKTIHHNAPGFEQSTDCIINSGDVTNNTLEKVGCEITNTHVHPDGTIYQTLDVNFYPYQFNQSLSFSPALVPVNMVYMNTIHPNKIQPTVYKDVVDKNMTYNIVGEFSATGYDGNETLSNFVNGCFARDVSMLFRHQYLSPLPDTSIENIGFAYDLVDMNKTNTGTIILPRKRVDSNLTSYGSNNTYVNLPVIQDGNISFAKDMKGSVYMDLGFNFDRNLNQPLNPRLIQISDFNLTLASPPATLNVNTTTNYQIYTNVKVDQNITFAYARSKPSKYFYDDITENSVLTPISVEVYCDLGYSLCAERGIDVINGQTSDSRWWTVIAHDNVGRQDGRIVLQTDNSSSSVSSPVLISNSNGVDNSVVVGYTGTNRPITVNITHVLPPATDFTDLWLMYNEFSSNAAPSPFYKVRFINSGEIWSGVGATGNVVGTSSANKKTQRMDW